MYFKTGNATEEVVLIQPPIWIMGISFINSLDRTYQKEDLKVVNIVELKEFLKFNAKGNKTMLELATVYAEKSKQETPIETDCCKAIKYIEPKKIKELSQSLRK